MTPLRKLSPTMRRMWHRLRDEPIVVGDETPRERQTLYALARRGRVSISFGSETTPARWRALTKRTRQNLLGYA